MPASHAKAAYESMLASFGIIGLVMGHGTSVSDSVQPSPLFWMHAGSCHAACRLARMLT